MHFYDMIVMNNHCVCYLWVSELWNC